jgi:outer membrane protein assembly factor BamB
MVLSNLHTVRSTHELYLLVTLLACAVSASASDHWPQFRGPTGLGYTDERDLPIQWGGESDENVLWKSPLVGEGHASPIVYGDRVFVCTARWPASVEKRELVIPEHHVLCYRVENGRLLWDVQVPPGTWLRTDFRSGPGGGYACPTPTTDGRLVYVVFGSSVIAALDFDGKIVWRHEIDPSGFDVTLGTSPILFGDTLLLACAMNTPDLSRIVAYDKRSGDILWQRKMPGTGFGHSTPVIIDVGAEKQMLFCAGGLGRTARALQSFDPATGECLWWCAGGAESASPAYHDGLVYFDSGRGGGGTVVMPTGNGDVSETHVKWRTSGTTPFDLGSPIIVGKHLYRIQRMGILTCWSVEDGRQIYKTRLERLSTSWASPVADPRGNIYFANAGTSHVIQAGPELKTLAVNNLGDGNHCSPAVARGKLFLVGREHVFCIGK